MENITDILKKRIDLYGVDSHPDFKTDYATATILVSLWEQDDSDNIRLKKMLTNSGKIEFWNTYENAEMIENLISADKDLGNQIMLGKIQEYKNPTDNTRSILGLVDTTSKKNKINNHSSLDSTKLNPLLRVLYPRADNQNGVYPGPSIGVSFGRDTARVNKYMVLDVVKANFPRDVKFLWSARPSNVSDVYELYAIKINPTKPGPELDGSSITDARHGYDQNGNPDVTITMNESGAVQWEKMTDEAAHSLCTSNGTSKMIKRCVAIALDDQVFSAPRVQNKILGGNTQITNIGSVNVAMDLAIILKSGPVRCRLDLLKERKLKDN